jgi:HEAT repeat protein
VRIVSVRPRGKGTRRVTHPDDRDLTPQPGDDAGSAPMLGGPGRASPGGQEPWLGGERGIQRWLDALHGGDNRAIWRAAQGLAASGPMAIPRLADGLTHPDHRVRAVAAWALGQLAGEEAVLPAVPRLIDLLDDPNRATRVVAASTLGRIAEAHPTAAAQIDPTLGAYRRRPPRP